MLKKPYEKIELSKEVITSLYGEYKESYVKRFEELFENFKKDYKQKACYLASSSGRVEVSGNHTDHNGGKVVSCAISLDTICCFMPTNDNVIKVKSQGYKEMVIDLNGSEKQKIGTSSALIQGVAEGLKQMGYKVGGFVAQMTSNVVGGAGISSSASFEVLIAEIFNFLYNNGKITKEEKAKVSQFSEREYFGKPCGLLDQTAIAFGGLKLLDFSDKKKIKVKNIDNELKDFTLVLINTGGSHADLTDEYAAVPKEMFEIAKLMGKERLIDLSKKEFLEKLPLIYDKVSDRAISRAVHFYTENERVDNVYKSLNKNDYKTFLDNVNKSGISSMCYLQNCFVAGRKEQPIIKAISVASQFTSGANRVHGGGFAGTTLNVIPNNELNGFIKNMTKFYSKENVIPLKVRKEGTIVL